MSGTKSRCSHAKHWRLSAKPFRSTVFFASASHVTCPLRCLSKGVVRTTSPAAPSLTTSEFIVETIVRSWQRAPATSGPVLHLPIALDLLLIGIANRAQESGVVERPEYLEIRHDT